jgi:dipeptidyl aminopeptidase/acylaminoacyl peptidase
MRNINRAAFLAAASIPASAAGVDVAQYAVGYVGVYDLPLMVSHTAENTNSAEAWMQQWVGEPAQLAGVSPVNLAAKIKVPVLLAAGGEDHVAPIEHSKRMEQALRAANVPVETLYERTEGHGFFTQAHQVEFYTRLLAFLDRNIGAGTVTASSAAAPAAGQAASPSN